MRLFELLLFFVKHRVVCINSPIKKKDGVEVQYSSQAGFPHFYWSFIGRWKDTEFSYFSHIA